MSGGHKGHKRGRRSPHGGPFVALRNYLLDSAAWGHLSPGPRALYVELKRRFNGANNGQIVLSHRDAAKALNVHRNTVGAWFRELEDHGFIHMKQGHHLGPSGVGLSAHWALDEEATTDGQLARKGFARWSVKPEPAQKPRTKSVHARPVICDA